MKVISQDYELNYGRCPNCGSHSVLIENNGKYARACVEKYSSDIIAQMIDCNIETSWRDTEEEANKEWR